MARVNRIWAYGHKILSVAGSNILSRSEDADNTTEI
jgi:hypothetical protein